MRPAAIGSALLVALTLAAYQPLVTDRGGFEFVSADDLQYVVNNPDVTGGLTRAGIRWAFTSRHESNWHPLTWISLQLDAQLHGVEPWGFHVTNLVLHLLNTVLLFLLLFRMTSRWAPSLLVAGLFAVHPLHVESVAWVTERKDLLSTSFALLAIGAYRAYAARPGWLRYLGVAALFALSLMAKSMWVTLPCLLLLLDVWPLERHRTSSWRRLLVEKIPLFALSALASAINVEAQDRMMEALAPMSLGARVANALVYYVTYVGRTLWPANLVLFRPNRGVAFPWPAVLGAGLALAAFSTVIWKLRRKQPHAPVGWLWFLGMLVPVIGVVQVGLVETTDHYTYAPLIGLFIVVAFADWSPPRWLAGALIAASLAACVLGSRHQLGYWRNSVTLWQHVVDVEPDVAIARGFLGRALEAQGRADEADAQFAKSSELDPTWRAHLQNGLALEQQGKLWESRRELEAVIRIAPHEKTALEHLAIQFQRRGELGDARQHYSTLARIEERAGQSDEAARYRRLALQCAAR